MSKSERVREYIAANPEASGTEIQSALKKEKTTVSLPLIYQILAKRSKPQRSKANGATNVSVDALMQVKKAVAEIGSLEETRKALNLLAKLSS